MTYTDEDLTNLITCKKRIIQPPRKEMRVEKHMLRNEMELESVDKKYSFRVFMRKSLNFYENFSIGIDYLPKDEPGSFCLLRCNGRHGGTKSHLHHLHYHVHRSIAEDVNSGLRIERNIETTSRFASFRDALNYFLHRINVQAADITLYFPDTIQTDMFGDEASS